MIKRNVLNMTKAQVPKYSSRLDYKKTSKNPQEQKFYSKLRCICERILRIRFTRRTNNTSLVVIFFSYMVKCNGNFRNGSLLDFIFILCVCVCVRAPSRLLKDNIEKSLLMSRAKRYFFIFSIFLPLLKINS